MRHNRLRRLGVNEQGSFTIEASLVFPIILLCTLTLLFVGMFVYQKVFVHQIALGAAERLAFSWNNSHKDLMTGNYNPSETDGLYWRLTQDNVTDLFGLLVSRGSSEVSIPSSSGGTNGGHVQKKLAKSSAMLPTGMRGVARYSNYLFDHRIEVILKKPFLMPPFLRKWFDPEQANGRGVSHVVDSVELIRLTDITRTYLKAIKGRISPEKAKEALKEPAQGDLSGPSVTIKSERQAAAYLKSLVGGREVVLTTMSGKSRTIDALDLHGIAHQAFYSVSESQLREEQMPKDVELLEQGTQIKGIVWHFFKSDPSGKSMPSDKFRKELERKGIVVVIHN
ncbi:hypothetical protein GK047_10760 [Paenibacillus sp. SYP-B3998]|uniref:Pilus assembly protein n=1 Tax=Paenibacillus sp. SYP-B3998 TaxID=2678564 RepID=A0A6G3ZY40_9BACL|nr:hypothetical protein [Paenibacillus sp. SYP-B3998]NEW06491.1 hypothetical protein [Paenibacillus sp. SYP-B3998]